MDGTTGALLASLSLLADIVLTVLFLSELRKGPGQLIFLQSQAQLLLDLHWVSISAICQTKTTTRPCATSWLCSITYSAAICVAVCIHFSATQIPSFWHYHLTIIPLSLGISLVIYFTGGANS